MHIIYLLRSLLNWCPPQKPGINPTENEQKSNDKHSLVFNTHKVHSSYTFSGSWTAFETLIKVMKPFLRKRHIISSAGSGAHIRTSETGLHLDASYCEEQFGVRSLDPNQGNWVMKVPQENRSPPGINSQYGTMGQAVYFFTCIFTLGHSSSKFSTVRAVGTHSNRRVRLLFPDQEEAERRQESGLQCPVWPWRGEAKPVLGRKTPLPGFCLISPFPYYHVL